MHVRQETQRWNRTEPMEMYAVKLQYFKESGKFGYDAEFETCHPYWDIRGYLAHLNQLKMLPGLKSGIWTGFIHIYAEAHGFPFMLQVTSNA